MLNACSLQLLHARLLAVAAEAVAALVWCGGAGHSRLAATTCRGGGGGHWRILYFAKYVANP